VYFSRLRLFIDLSLSTGSPLVQLFRTRSSNRLRRQSQPQPAPQRPLSRHSPPHNRSCNLCSHNSCSLNNLVLDPSLPLALRLLVRPWGWLTTPLFKAWQTRWTVIEQKSVLRKGYQRIRIKTVSSHLGSIRNERGCS
jgi:hypothetical protein